MPETFLLHGGHQERNRRAGTQNVAGIVGLVGHRFHPATFEIVTGHAVEGAAGVPRPSLAATARTAAIWLAIWLVPVAALALFLGPDHVFTQVGTFFSTA